MVPPTISLGEIYIGGEGKNPFWLLTHTPPCGKNNLMIKGLSD